MMGDRGESARAMQRLEARVLGDVQGVGFRWFVRRAAAALGLVGWVANDPDGSVAVVAEGPVAALEELRSAIESGPPGARVEAVTAHLLAPTGRLVTFEIRSGGHGGD